MPVIQKLATPFTTTTGLRKRYRDPLLNPGSRALFDFGNSYCRNSLASGALASGATFRNLVDGGPSGVYAASTLTEAVLDADGITFPGLSTGNNAWINCGSTYDDITTLDHAFLAILWVRKVLIGPGGNFAGLFSILVSAGSGMFGMDQNSAAGPDARVIANIKGGVPGYQPISLTLGTPLQIGVSWRPPGPGETNGLVVVYKNGVMVGQVAATDALDNLTGINLLIGHVRANAEIFRAYLEDTTVSGVSALTQVAADYSLNSSRFV